MTTTRPLRLARRTAALLILLMLAACSAGRPRPPANFAPLRYDYLTKIVLAVGAINIDASRSPPPIPGELGPLSPETPEAALRQMAQDRLYAGGGPGQATFTIEDASIVQLPGQLQATFAVRLDVSDGPGGGSGYAEARVVRTAPFRDESLPALRAALYDLTRATMESMNVEFEYQVRRSLGRYFRAPGTAAPASGQIETQPLPAPGEQVPAGQVPGAPLPLAPPAEAPAAPDSPPPSSLPDMQLVPPSGITPAGPLRLQQQPS